MTLRDPSDARLLLSLGAALLLAACGRSPVPAAAPAPATTVYSGGDILTMAGREPAYAEALAVRDGKILAVGTRADVDKAVGAGATQVVLAGKTLVPGFIDTHGHMVYFGKNLMCRPSRSMQATPRPTRCCSRCAKPCSAIRTRFPR